MAFKTKTDFWGHTSYYDEDGKLIGKEEMTWLGDRVIKDSSGNTVGRPETDIYGRETITLEEDSLFFGRTRKTILKDGELEDWEMCENCGDYINGEDDMYCDDCLHDH